MIGDTAQGAPPIAPLDIDPRQRYYTTTQPFSYRDTLTVLAYLNEVAGHLEEVRQSLDDLAKDEAADITEVKNSVLGFKEHFDAIDETLGNLAKQVGKLENTSISYNPTRGVYENTRQTNRDIYRELAVFGARVDQLATITAKQAAAHTCLETAVIGNKTIFNHADPRVTPRKD